MSLTYLCWIRSISLLLMPCILVSLGCHQPWYWLCEIGKSFSYSRKDSSCQCYVSVEEWNCQHLIMFLLKHLAWKKLNCIIFRWYFYFSNLNCDGKIISEVVFSLECIITSQSIRLPIRSNQMIYVWLLITKQLLVVEAKLSWTLPN